MFYSEINWDCPCLGGMAHGPCGEEFKAAFCESKIYIQIKMIINFTYYY